MTRLITYFRTSIRYIDPWLVVAVSLGAGLRFSRLGDYENPYYTATVASMLQSWHNFIFASFDPLGFVMVDKPPASFWVETIPAAIFGVSAWSVSLPQAIMGTIAIVLLYVAIKPAFGRIAATASALTLAVIPVSVIIDSRNEPDSLVAFALVCSALSLILAVKTRKWRWLVLFSIMMGVGFNAKMLVAFVAAPAFLLYYIASAKHKRTGVLLRVAITTFLTLILSLSWVVLIDLTPNENRPYVGSTSNNSIWTLLFEYNGLRRFTSFSGPPRNAITQNQPDQAMPDRGPLPYPPYSQQSLQPRQMPQPGPVQLQSPPQRGILSLLHTPLSNQLGWALPLALLMIAVSSFNILDKSIYERPKSIFMHLRSSEIASQSLIWLGWFATALIIFGTADSTATHPYYLVGIAIPMSAVIGIGFSYVVKGLQQGKTISWLCAAVIATGIVLQVHGAWPAVSEWAVTIVAVVTSVGTLVLIKGLWRGLHAQSLTNGALMFIGAAMLLIPTITSLSAGGRIVGPPGGVRPLAQTAPMNEPNEQFSRILTLIQSHKHHRGSIHLATLNAREAAPFIIAGVPAIAIGGFSGRDPILTIESFIKMSRENGPTYFLIPSRPLRGNFAPRTGQQPLLDFIHRNWNDVSMEIKLPTGTLYRNPL
jgi:4-amino-4-deoxy-L-arabinose transferase-like glycosyltransferase